MGLVPKRFININCSRSTTPILPLTRSTISLRSVLILIRRVFLAFCYWMVMISVSSNWLNLSFSKSEIRRPVNIPSANSRQNLYFLSLSNFDIRDMKSFQSMLAVVVLCPNKLIMCSFGYKLR